jgi:ABC-2 type transport system permease protein
MFKGIFPVFKQELYSDLYSSIACIFLVLFIVVPNFLFFFFGGIFKEDNATMRTYFTMIPYVFIFFIPGLTMGAWAKEKNAGTLELLLTLPLRSIDVLLGKFLAALTLVVIALAFTLPIPILTHFMLGNFDLGQLFAQYIGAIFIACTYIAITFFMSSLTNELINSFLLSASFLLVLNLIGYLSMAIKFFNWLEWLQNIFNYIGLQTHFMNFSKGVIDSRDIIFYIGLTALFFYLNIRTLEIKRWS